MQLGESILAGLVLAVCLALLLRLAIGPRRRARLDDTLRRAWIRGPQRAWNDFELRRTRRRLARQAAERRAESARLQAAAESETEAVIRRARAQAQGRERPPGSRPEAEVEGNVIHPKAFRKPEPGATHPGNDTRH